MSAPTSPMAGRLTQAQYDYLRDAIAADRVRQMQGQSHLEAWDVRRTLIRVFGFGGFDIEDRGTTLVKEIEYPGATPQGKSRWTVVYLAKIRLIIKDAEGREIAHFDDAATGDAINMPSIGDAHDFGLKTASSQALKRCAVNLGDQFGLSLYNKGNTGGVVVRSLVSPSVQADAPTPQDAPRVLGGEMDETSGQEPEIPAQRSAPVASVPAAPAVPRVETERLALINAVAEAAKLAGVDLNVVLKRWATEHDGQHIREATDRGSLELYRDELLNRAGAAA